jgi:uncharacterized protein (DUF2126 family)
MKALKDASPPTLERLESGFPFRSAPAAARRTRRFEACHSHPGALLLPTLSRRTFSVPGALGLVCLINGFDEHGGR